jgi:hypothetical protein
MFQSPVTPIKSSTNWIALQCHAASSPGAVASVEVKHERIASRLKVHYRITGDISSLRIPVPQSATRRDELWRHTCMEIFLARADSAGYSEFNFSPSLQWAAYQFASYREGMMSLSGESPTIIVSSEARLFLLSATVQLPPICAARSLQMGLSAVIEDCAGTCSYWALQHDTVHPDFHRSENWVQRI